MSAEDFPSSFMAALASREATSIPCIFESLVEISSAMPSLKYELSASVLRFFSGKTAMEGRAAATAPDGEEFLRCQK